jgi:hypothetical protein
MTITKLDVAEREIVAAVRMFFDGGDAVAVYVLAAPAREIITTLCKERGVRSMIDGIHGREYPNLKKKRLYSEACRRQCRPANQVVSLERKEDPPVSFGLECVTFGATALASTHRS